MLAEVLPKLALLQLGQHHRDSESTVKAVNKFIARRKLSGHAISVTFGDGVCRFLLPYYLIILIEFRSGPRRP